MPKIRPNSSLMAAQRLAAFALILGAVAACSDPFKVKAQYENADQAFFVHALSGSPVALATALLLPAKSVTRVDGTFNFDIAFDINAQGDIILLPVGVVGQNTTGNRRVGILKPGGSYEGIGSAPLSGYVYDTVTVVKRGESAIIQAQQASCGLALSPYLYAKIIIDSIDVASRSMYGRTTIDLNCGFRSLTAGLPAS
jgi:hypothetical protein